MRWRDLGYYVLIYGFFSILDSVCFAVFQWPMNDGANKLMAGFAVVLIAIRERHDGDRA